MLMASLRWGVLLLQLGTRALVVEEENGVAKHHLQGGQRRGDGQDEVGRGVGWWHMHVEETAPFSFRGRKHAL